MLHNLHDERNERFDENLATLRKIAPLLKEVDEFLAEVTLAVMVSEKLEELRRDNGRHMGNELLIKL